MVDITFRSAGGSLIERPRPAVGFRLDIVGGRSLPPNPALRPPPAGISGVPEWIDNAGRRWADVVSGKESLPAGAYWVLDVLEHNYGGRKGIADRLMVSNKLLNELGRLVSTGDMRTGRKVGKKPSDLRALSNIELTWIEGLVERLLQRAIAVEFGGMLAHPLTITDYPPGSLIITLPDPDPK